MQNLKNTKKKNFNDTQQRFSIRKCHFGATSILLGAFIALSGQSVYANTDATTGNTNPSETTTDTATPTNSSGTTDSATPVGTQPATTETQPTTAETKNYLVANKNYYEDTNINKGDILGRKVSEITQDFARLKATYGDALTEDTTVLEFYTKFGYAPEDRYYVRNNVIDNQGRVAVSSNREGTQTTFELPHTIKNYVKNGATHGVKDPNLFSRLTVGEQPQIWTTVNKSWGSWFFSNSVENLEVMKDLIGYGWDGTVDDFLLNPENKNNFVIPTRFNTERNDIWLTMRGGSPDRYGSYLTGARAHLSAVSDTGKEMVEKNDATTTASDDYYINTTTKLGISEEGFDSLGEGFLGGKNVVGGEKIFEKVNNGEEAYGIKFQDLRNRLVTHFSNDVSTNLETYENAATGINNGVGGQIQLTGLYRISELDKATLANNIITEYANYLADEKSRADESVHNTNVEYYMYEKDNKENLYSPNKSVFKIETTRPYFTNFGNLSEVKEFKFNAENINELLTNQLGLASFGLEDNGIDKAGNKIGVDKNNVRVMITLDGEIKERNLTLDTLNASLLKNEYLNKELKLFYTYAGLDADKSIEGLLPIEIATNTGAYAVPIVRTVNIFATLMEENHTYKTVESKATINGDTIEFVKEKETVDETENKYQTEATRKIIDSTTTTTQDVTPPTVTNTGYELVSVTKVVYGADGTEVSSEELDINNYKNEVTVEDNLAKGQKVVYNYVYERKLEGVVTVKHITVNGDTLVPHKIATDSKTGQTLEKLVIGSEYNVGKDGEILTDKNGVKWKFKQLDTTSAEESSTTKNKITTIIYVYEKVVEPVTPPTPTPTPPTTPENPVTPPADNPNNPTPERPEGPATPPTTVTEVPRLTSTGLENNSSAIYGVIALGLALLGLRKKNNR